MPEEIGTTIEKYLEVRRKQKQPPGEWLKEWLVEGVELRQEITTYLIEQPGALLYLSDPQLCHEATKAMNELLAAVKDQDIWDEIRYGDSGGNMQVTYAMRAKKVRPTFISYKPPAEVAAYYREAMKAWLHGLDGAALILCCLIIERLIKERLMKKNLRLIFNIIPGRGFAGLQGEKTLEEMLQTARAEHLITEQDFRNARRIRKSRNDVVHRQRVVRANESEEAILDTKSVMERLLS